MRAVPISLARDHWSIIVADVVAGQRILLTRYAQPWVGLTRLDPARADAWHSTVLLGQDRAWLQLHAVAQRARAAGAVRIATVHRSTILMTAWCGLQHPRFL